MISVILTTVRPENVQRCVDSLVSSDPVELVIVSDFLSMDLRAPGGLAVKWVMMPRSGTVDAVNAGYRMSSGEWIFVLSDETVLGESCLDYLLLMAENGGADSLWTPYHEPPFNFVYYGHVFAPFPFMHRSLIDRLKGVFFDPCYRCFYADPDLSLRAYEAGVSVSIAASAKIAHHQNHDLAHNQNMQKYLDADRAAFRARWDHLGPFIDP